MRGGLEGGEKKAMKVHGTTYQSQHPCQGPPYMKRTRNLEVGAMNMQCALKSGSPLGLPSGASEALQAHLDEVSLDRVYATRVRVNSSIYELIIPSLLKDSTSSTKTEGACQASFRGTPRCAMWVNHSNTPAIRLQRLGKAWRVGDSSILSWLQCWGLDRYLRL